MAYSLVNIPLLVAIMRGGWRSKRTRVLLLIVAALAVLIWRPHWMGEIFESLPVIRSTRWPFREIIVLLFFVHLLFIYNYRPLPRRWNATQWVFAWLPMLLLLRAGPPTMGSVELSRKLIISGAADSYWTAMGPLSSKLPSVAATDLDTSGGIDASAPYPLLPSHNFPALFGVRSVSGYSTGTPLWLDPHRIFPPTLTGIFSLDEARIYLAHFPAARLTVLHSVDPPVWSIVGHESGRTLTIDPDTLAIRDAPPP